MQAPIDNALLNGEWRLIYATEAVTRSSPFFWAFRKATSGTYQPIPLLPAALSDALFAITDGIPFASVGSATQTITGFGNSTGTLVSSVQVSLTDSSLSAEIAQLSMGVLFPESDEE